MESNEKKQFAAKANTPRNLGFEATTDNDFCFVSYNSDDCDRISQYALQLYNAGIPLWYDKGLVYGEKWEEEIGVHIANSRVFILFFTKGILEKQSSYVEKEFRIAKNQRKYIYVLMVDNLEKDYWTMYPRKSSFLDDVNQMHSCSCNSIEHLINLLKIVNPQNTSVVPTTVAKSKNPALQAAQSTSTGKKAFPFSEPTIVDSEVLLNGGYFNAKELSQRHIDLDLQTVDANLFPDAIEIEGDADTWENMVVDTADCTGNLIINNQIVGYMDFIPVSPENYNLLRTEPFSDKYVAFYSFGGNFDIYVSTAICTHFKF